MKTKGLKSESEILARMSELAKELGISPFVVKGMTTEQIWSQISQKAQKDLSFFEFKTSQQGFKDVSDEQELEDEEEENEGMEEEPEEEQRELERDEDEEEELEEEEGLELEEDEEEGMQEENDDDIEDEDEDDDEDGEEGIIDRIPDNPDEDYQNFMDQMEQEDMEMNQVDLDAEESESTSSKGSKDEKKKKAPAANDNQIESAFDDLRFGTNEKNIARIEQKLISKKEWQLQGEVRASDRPVNALIEEDLEFDRGLEPKQKLSAQAQAKIEDIIKARVKDQLFDDRQMVTFSRNVINEQSKYLVDPEKDRRGLGDLYEETYKKEVLGIDSKAVESNKKHLEIRDLFRKICFSIDQMSRLHFTPVGGLPSAVGSGKDPFIVEEKMSGLVTADLLRNRESYKEVFNPLKRDLVSRAEMTKEERKSLRRKIKRIKHVRAEKEKKKEGVKTGLTQGQVKLLEKNMSKVKKQIADSKVKRLPFNKSSDFIKNQAKQAGF